MRLSEVKTTLRKSKQKRRIHHSVGSDCGEETDETVGSESDNENEQLEENDREKEKERAV
jgi:hypothetical protein